jgi:hypothetical protein
LEKTKSEFNPQPKISIITSFYRGIDFLPGFFENLGSQNCLEDTELVFIHNAPLQEELALVNSFIDQRKLSVKHIIVEAVEPLSASWNRGIREADGEFLAFWNVDDRRTPFGIANQVSTLITQSAQMTYGDYIETSSYSSDQGLKIITPQFSFRAFSRGFPSGGAFMVFRANTFIKAGLFDEQFKCCVDFEYLARLTVNRFKISKSEGILGYFTNENHGISTREGEKLRRLEDTVIQIRYGIFDKVRRELLEPSQPYQINQIKQGTAWFPIQLYCPEVEEYVRSKKYLWILGYPRNTLRQMMSRLGLWDWAVNLKLYLSGRVRRQP